MLRQILSKSAASILGGLIAVVLIAENVTAQERYFRNLPEGWKIEESFFASKEETMAISRKLGARIWKLSNTHLSVNGQPLQVNILHCRTTSNTEKIYNAVLEAHGGNTDSVMMDGNNVIEFVCRDIDLVRQAHKVLKPLDIKEKEVPKKQISTALFKKLPIGWKVEESFVVPEDQAKSIGQKLGGQIKKVSNTILSAHGNRIQANIIEATSQEDADKIYQAVLDGHYGFEQCVFQDGTKVLEFTCEDINLVIKAGWELGLRPKPKKVKYRITFEAAPIKTGDFMSWNRLFNLFCAYDESHNEEGEKQIRALSGRFQFANEIQLRSCGTGEATPTYNFKPAATDLKRSPHLDTALYVFDNLRQKAGVPFVFVEANVTTHEGGFTRSLRNATEDLLVRTEFWPVDDTEIKALAAQITLGCNNDQEKVKAILGWLAPGKNIKFSGPVTGSRYGVKKVLDQGFGQCWDFSDCFVTLCRSAGVPCRQVAGWLYATCGHIWAEVLYAGKGWEQVDPTGGGIVECGIYHILYLTSEDGSMPILYVSMPKTELIEP